MTGEKLEFECISRLVVRHTEDLHHMHGWTPKNYFIVHGLGTPILQFLTSTGTVPYKTGVHSNWTRLFISLLYDAEDAWLF